MAIRSEELTYQTEAVIYRFPPVRRRLEARRAVLRRRAALAAVGLIVVGAGLFATGPSGSSTAATNRAPRSVVLHEGDTVWEIADRYAPENMDVRGYIDAIVELNGLSGLPEPGTKLRLP